MSTLDLFPEITVEAKRNKKLKRRAKVVGAKMRLADDASGMQDFILRVLKERGISDASCLLVELDELCEGSDRHDISKAQGRLFRSLLDMWRAGILWKHEWSYDEWVWGIRGVHSKKEMLRKAREEEEAFVAGLKLANEMRKSGVTS